MIKNAKRKAAGILNSEKMRETADSTESSHGMPNHSSEESYNCTYSFESKSFWKEDEGLPVFSSLNPKHEPSFAVGQNTQNHSVGEKQAKQRFDSKEQNFCT